MIQIQLQLDWKPNAQFAGILFAHHSKWYANAGLDLDIIPWKPYLNQVEVLKADGNIIVSTEDNLLIQGCTSGQAIRAIATMMQYSGIGWMTQASSGIRDISDLKGKKVGIHGDGETALKISLEHYGISPSEVSIVEVGFEYPQLLNGQEFAALQCLVAIEPLELQDEGFDLHIMPAYKWGYEVYSQVLATSDRLIHSEAAAIQDFLGITFDGWRYAFSQPDEVASLIVSQYLRESSPPMQARLIQSLQPLFEGSVGLDKLGWMVPERWEKSMKYLESHGLIQQVLTPDQVMTNDFMAAIYG